MAVIPFREALYRDGRKCGDVFGRVVAAGFPLLDGSPLARTSRAARGQAGVLKIFQVSSGIG
jgi:hypothetical protein